MASESYPNSAHNSGAVTTTEWEQLAHRGLGTGLIGSPSDSAVVYGDSSGMQVKIRSDKRAAVRGAAWYSGATDITVAISANTSGSTRVDIVVLRLTKATGVVAEAVVEGNPGSGAPSLTRDTGTTGTYEFPLARVTVAHNASTISAGNVNLDGWYLAPQPVAGATTTLPAAADQAPGMLVYDSDEDEAYVSSGSALRLLYGDSGWLTPTAASGWALDSRAKYRRLTNSLALTFAANRTGGNLAAGTDSLMLTLPAGYRPSQEIQLVGYIDGGNIGRAYIDTSGRVYIANYSQTFETGDTFTASVSFPI